MEDTALSTNKTENLPMDYTVTWDEDTQIGEILTEAFLTDIYAIGPYQVTLYKGMDRSQETEARLLESLIIFILFLALFFWLF